MKNLKFALALLLLCFFIAACAFQPRNTKEFPDALRTLCFEPEKPYDTLAIQLRGLFQSMKVNLVKNPADAHYTLKIVLDYFSYSPPQIVDATLPSSINFSQTATVIMIDNRTKQTLLTKSFTTSGSLTLNLNQIYTANSNELMRQQLNHELVSLIYYWLISEDTKNTLK